MWRIRKDGGLARADAAAFATEAARDRPGAFEEVHTLLGVARGTSPAVAARSLEALDLTVNAVPDLTGAP